jgi:hypothetical protein
MPRAGLSRTVPVRLRVTGIGGIPGPAGARELIAELIDAGARHFVLGPVGAPSLQWVADEIVRHFAGTVAR